MVGSGAEKRVALISAADLRTKRDHCHRQCWSSKSQDSPEDEDDEVGDAKTPASNRTAVKSTATTTGLSHQPTQLAIFSRVQFQSLLNEDL